jgi:hypothetical protein
MYTLKSKIKGKYISSLFSDNHLDTFSAADITAAYWWTNKADLIRLVKGNNITDCEIVDVRKDIDNSLPEFLKPQG